MSSTSMSGASRLRRELSFSSVIAMSIAIIAPTAAMALNGVSASELIGRAAPLAFIFAAVGIAIVAVGFIHLTRRYNHAGSVYAFCGVVLGPRVGFCAAWTLLGTYTILSAAALAETGIFGTSFISNIDPGSHISWAVIAIPLAVIAVVLAAIDMRRIARMLLTLEGASVALIVILVVVIFVRLLGGSAPDHQTVTVKAFELPSQIPFGTVALAAVFGFLSFAGFEASASMGEESTNPRRDIPRAIAIAVGASAVFFVIVVYAQTVGFGVGNAGVKAFSGSASPLGDLSRTYIGTWMADLINIGATASAFSAGLGALIAAARLLFALGRDGFISPRLGVSSRSTGAPVVAVAVLGVLVMLGIIYMAVVGVGTVNAFFYPATIGALGLLVAYIAASVAAMRSMHNERGHFTAISIVPAVAAALLLYVIYRNVYPAPAAPADAFPYVVAAWVLAGVVIAVAAPVLTGRIGRSLARAEGIASDNLPSSVAPPPAQKVEL